MQENGPNTGFNLGLGGGGRLARLSAGAMRFRGVPVLTNTPPRGPQRGPGQNQIATAIEPLIDKRRGSLGLDRVAIRRINAPDNDAKIGSMGGASRALSKGRARSRRRASSTGASARSAPATARKCERRRRHGVSLAGGNGFDGLVRITPDGKIHIHTGVGNLGTYSHTVTSRVAAEMLKANWDNCIVVRGDSSKHLPWNLGSSAATRRSR